MGDELVQMHSALSEALGIPTAQPEPHKGWDHRYRCLREGEIILATDECQNDDGSWSDPGPTVGNPAPDPAYGSHRVYRRLRGEEA